MQFYGVEIRRVLDYPFNPYYLLLSNSIVNNDELSTGGIDNTTAYSNTSIMDTMDIPMIPAYKLLTNLIVENSALSMGGGGNLTMSTNKNMMSTFTNETVKYTDMDDDNISILINYAVQELQYDTGQQVNGLYF